MIFRRGANEPPPSLNITETPLSPGSHYQLVLKFSGHYYSLIRRSTSYLYVSVKYVQFNFPTNEYIFITDEADQLIKLGAKEYSDGWWLVRATCKSHR